MGISRHSGAIASILERHPCFGSAPENAGRIHLPVAPGCNISCKFCTRGFDKSSKRPGVAAGLLRPREAAVVVGRALELCPDISVVGVAGPGDSLAGTHGLEALKAVHARFPLLIKCLSTNGLLLVDKLDRILEAGVWVLTVTVNALDPDVIGGITPKIAYRKKVYRGREAGEILIQNQLAGIALAALNNLVIKVNTVLIPGVNDDQIGIIARTVALAGAARINIIPLIPQGEFSEFKAPSCGRLQKARDEAERHLPVFKHCRQCRADAVGKVGGRDFGPEIYEGLDVPMTFSHG